ncbi:uncharacterized protein BT62DRAFT_1071360 [Guyanagaster necrorhizus]|uniref:Exosome complex protein n=1 Tax=Guyanagaster necrorhizus TaxID=856835 RepID=A0A9P7W3Y4_9AGAR|nr:uncharacterized protein BT62DRAFT_1071360 [Guyanagaster necrorhizus MCA 3950]KAG7452192.1 hypothetical protein BT62DRAFT_1071360 [Guyanagaster necrorhizus MCA 3950]
MTSETAKAKSKLVTLSSSLSELEAQLEPLFTQTLPETLLPLEPVDQAKLQTLLTYVTYDLVFIYLKSRGIDPKTHPVVSELDRIKGYFDKIDKAEKPETRHIQVDRAAAGRFIKHAITQAKVGRPPGDTPAEPMPGLSNVHVPVKVTDKMLERRKYEKEMKERDAAESSEESDLEIFDEKIDDDGDEKVDVKGKGKVKEQSDERRLSADISAISRTKRRRATVDPFAGYGDDAITSANQPNETSSNDFNQTKPKKKKQKSKDSTSAADLSTPQAKAEKKAKKGTRT